jgi:hypothetical protein
MKCIACGRDMVDRETYYECSNVLCDYEEEIETRETWARLKPVLPGIMGGNAVISFS